VPRAIAILALGMAIAACGSSSVDRTAGTFTCAVDGREVVSSKLAYSPATAAAIQIGVGLTCYPGGPIEVRYDDVVYDAR
jgi:hypothetical protein